MSSSKTALFLDAVCAEIRWRRWRSAIRRELSDHLEDRIEYLTTQRGLTFEEAEEEAVNAMGDPAEVGRALDREHRPWRFYLFVFTTLAFWSAILYAAYLLFHDLLMLY